ncbi:MAG TPA: abortive infection family protein [Pyrinomonadaceae bacterium]|nr:abortive infection family protein [Pyrinomonadaceae bacterium]
MAETSLVARFQMSGARAAILSGPTAESLDQLIQAIENAIEGVPDFAFGLCKALVESVCKTVLADMGHPADPNWDAPRLVRETTNRLALLPDGYPNPGKTRDSIEKTVRGLLQTIQGLCELRNEHDIASHGRDAFSPRLSLRQATLAAQAADTIVAFLYRIHRDAVSRTPGERVYYEDHKDFNDSFDQDNELVRIGEVEFLPSRVLFHTDREAYKGALNDYILEREGRDDTNTAPAATPQQPT